MHASLPRTPVSSMTPPAAAGLVPQQSEDPVLAAPPRYSESAGSRPYSSQQHSVHGSDEECGAKAGPGPDGKADVSRLHGVVIVALLGAASFTSSTTTGLLATSMPHVAADLGMRTQESYWPTSVYNLSTGALLLLAGAVADVVGSRRVFLVGCTVMAVFTLVCGFARAGNQLVVSRPLLPSPRPRPSRQLKEASSPVPQAFRALQGIGFAMCLPSSMGVLTAALPPGQRRNVGIACTSVAQTLGFCFGLVFGGVCVDTVGWRAGWWISAGVLAAVVPAGAVFLPRDAQPDDGAPIWAALRCRVDWVGTGIACACSSLLALGLLQISADATGSCLRAQLIAPLVGSAVLMPVFGWWMGFAEKKGWPALIPNRLWKAPFVGICSIVLLSYAVMQTFETFCPLLFGESV